jgi:8-oxo-dGTP pyrophosphatase MutT (NUDIX family)
MISASGCVMLSLDTGRLCLQLRGSNGSHAGTWSFWGGKSKRGERPINTLLREMEEEIGILPDVEKVYPLHKFISTDGNFEYQAFIVTVFEEFVPTLNSESDGYAWVDIDKYPRPLHRGAKAILLSDDIKIKLHTIIELSASKTSATNWLDSFKSTHRISAR